MLGTYKGDEKIEIYPKSLFNTPLRKPILLAGTATKKGTYLTTFVLEAHPYINSKTGKTFYVSCLSPTWVCPHCTSTEEYPPNLDKIIISLFLDPKGNVYYIIEPSDTILKGIPKTNDKHKCLMSHAAGFKHAFTINSFTFLKSYPAGSMLYSGKVIQDTFKIARKYVTSLQEGN
jgi:hypothetical protein